MTRWLLALALAAVVPAPAVQAGLLPVKVSVAPEAGNFRWTYAVVLPSDMKLQSGNFFTVYDFGGLVAGSIVAPDGWSATVTKTTTPPLGLKPNDDAAVDNITFTYSGPTIESGQVGLGNFWAVSTGNKTVTTEFTASNIQFSTGNVDRNIVSTIAPAPPGINPPTGVPEPATMAMAALGLLPVAAARRLRKKK